MEERGEGQGGSRCGRSQGSENAVWLEGDRAAGAFRLCLGSCEIWWGEEDLAWSNPDVVGRDRSVTKQQYKL